MEVTETRNEDHPDAAHGEGTFGISSAFYDRSKTYGRTEPNRVVTKCTVQIPEDVDHWREEWNDDEYGMANEREYAESIALRWFAETYGFRPSSVTTQILVQEFRDSGIRPSDGYRSGFHVWIDTNPDFDPEIPESAVEM